MRITVIDVEHDDAAAAIAAIHAALGARSNGTTATGHNIVASQRVTPALEAAKPKPKKAPPPEEMETVPVSKEAYATWDWLVAHNRPAGTHIHEIARAMGLKDAATHWRLRRLREAGLAYTVKRGYWRAGERQ